MVEVSCRVRGGVQVGIATYIRIHCVKLQAFKLVGKWSLQGLFVPKLCNYQLLPKGQDIIVKAFLPCEYFSDSDGTEQIIT